MTEFEQLSNIIRTRRSIFPACYIDKPIEDELIMQILENANWAPTHRKTEPCRFKVMKGEALEKLSDFAVNFYTNNTSAEDFSAMKLKKNKNKPLKCACVIAICMKRDERQSVPEWEEEAAVACAVQNMWLSCTTLGIGAYWSTPKSIDDSKEFLGLKSGEKCMGFFYMGYYGEVDAKSERGPIANKVEWL